MDIRERKLLGRILEDALINGDVPQGLIEDLRGLLRGPGLVELMDADTANVEAKDFILNIKVKLISEELEKCARHIIDAIYGEDSKDRFSCNFSGDLKDDVINALTSLGYTVKYERITQQYHGKETGNIKGIIGYFAGMGVCSGDGAIAWCVLYLLLWR